MKDVIRYCGYWHNYSRILTHSCVECGGMQVEVNLTPIPCCHSSSWATDVAPIRIRAHCTARGSGDLGMTILPEKIRAEMVKNLGAELVERLLTEDFLSLIDWDKYRAVNNGGANLGDILKG